MIAFLISRESIAVSFSAHATLAKLLRMLTFIAEDGGRNAGGKLLVQIGGPAHARELVFLGGRKHASASPSSGAFRVNFEAEDAQVRCSQRDCATTAACLSRLARIEGRVDARGNDARTGNNPGAERSVRRKEHMPGQLSDGDHVWRLLELDCLRVDKFTLVVQDDKGVGTALDLVVHRLVGRVAVPRQDKAAEAARDGENLCVLAVTAHDAQMGCARRQRRRANDNSGDPDELGNGVGVKVAHTQQVGGQLERDLDIRCLRPLPSVGSHRV